MEQDYLLKLTIAAYKISNLLPEKEPLRIQIKESIGKVLVEAIKTDFFTEAKAKALAEIQALSSLFSLAETQNWVNPRNLLILKQEYAKLGQSFNVDKQTVSRKAIEQEPKHTEEPVFKPRISRPASPDLPRISPKKRQEKIVSMLDIKKRLDLSELRKIFPRVGARTLRRDMEALLEKGLISRKRNGQKDVTYQSL